MGALVVLSFISMCFMGTRFDIGYYYGGDEGIDFALIGILCAGAAMCIGVIMMFWMMP